MKQLLKTGLIVLSMGLIPMIANAAPVQVVIGDFSGSETVLTFDGLMEDQVITNNFLGQGVDFSNSAHVSASTATTTGGDSFGFFSNPGTSVLQNFDNGGCGGG